jgi:hypothetical protein
MHSRLAFIIGRLNADLAATGVGVVSLVEDPEPGWAGIVFAFGGSMTTVSTDQAEVATAVLADKFQDDVVGSLGRTWPEVDGRPLFPSAASGVACWCLDGKPWCAVGQLADALAAAGEVERAGSAG